MFEGLVSQLLAGYLGRYVKEFQKDQLKIGFWDQEVKLEDVKLILEAFDYLQLPVALKEGRVGKLSIKIPWKSLGRDPIIIVLEDVFISACQRDDYEWSLDSIERREFSGKKAKLAAAELAKLSRRVCDNQSGRSFISYISAKILDGIQVSVRNVHVTYMDNQNDPAQFLFGLRFSSLTIMTDSHLKQKSVGTSNGKVGIGQVNKIVEILGLAIYCNTSEEGLNLLGSVDSSGCNRDEYILEPFDATVSLVVNKSGKLESDIPQYTMSAELIGLVILFNEAQLKQILILMDYLGTCALRRKYGRYRPWQNPVSHKVDGWQRMWWHYAQESILSDVHKKLRKISWSHFGRRISYRRKYVKLYRKKLVFLFQEQPVSEDILRELEQMEKESEIDDILNYRSIAENQLKEFLSSINSSSTINNLDTVLEKQQIDDRSSNKQRGWLNWLSLGMLGAGGTTDSSQFAGVISDETIKAIYEATKFHPLPSFDGVSNTVKDNLYLSSIKLNIQQIIAGLRSKKDDNEIIRVIFDGVTIENKLWEDSVTILSSINSVEMIEPSKQHVILVTKKDFLENSSSKHTQPFVSIQVQTLPFNRDREMSIKVLVQPFEVTYDPNILLHLMNFRRVWWTFQFQHQRVLSSLNGFDNLNVRLLLKSEYIFLNRTKMTLDLRFSNVTINFPWRNKESESFNMVLDVGGLLFRSIPKNELLGSANKDQSCHLVANILHSTTMEEMKLGLQLQDLYDFFQIDLTDLELSIMMPNFPQAFSVFNRFSGSLIFGSCMFLDESTLKQLEVHCSLSSLAVHFSPSLYDALVRLMTCFDISFEDSNMERTNASDILHYSLAFDVDHVICNVNLEDCVEKSLFITLSLEKLNFQYAHHELLEFWICMKTLDINSSPLEGDSTGHVLCSHRNSSITSSKDAHIGILSEACSENSVSAEGCFLLHYQAARQDLDVHHNYTIFLNNMELHIYPRIIGLLVGFFNKISKLGGSSSVSSADNSLKLSLEIEDPEMMYGINLMKYGISNYCEAGSTTLASIPFHNFPFATICNLGCFADLDKSAVLGLSEWRRTACVRSRNSVRSQKWSVRKKSRMFNLSTDKSTTSGGSDGCDVFSIDLNLNEIRVHFHDSSCIVGTLTLPLANSVIFSQRQDCWDILGSIDGLLVSSSWSSPNIREILWGSSLQEVSSILNFRVTKGKDEALDPKLEICIAVQHVCCILSPEYLAILIGYFSLSDWTSNKAEEVVAENPKYGRITPTYKFEILDSSVIFPLEGNSLYSLQLGIQQLVGSFVEKGSSTDVFKGIPKECLIPPSQIAGKVNCINVFGSSISLSLLLLEANGHLRLQLDPDTSIAKVPFISQLDADLWVRIPHNTNDSVGPSIMMHAEFCQITAEEDYMLSGLNAFQYIVDGFATVGRDSKCFASDILQFKQLKKSLNEVTVGSNGNSSDTLIETKFFVNSFSIKLNQSGSGITHPSKLVAELEMRLALSVTFRNDTPICLDVGISGLVLYSSCSSVILVSSPSYDSNSSCLEIHFSKSDSGKDEVALSVPSVDIWIYLSDWIELILLLGSYKVERKPSAITASKGANWDLEVPKYFGSEKAPTSPLSKILIEPSDLIVKSENISLSFHFPVWVKEGAFDNSGEVKSCFKREKKMGFDGKDCKSIAFTLYSRGTECVISKGSVKLKSNVEKIRGMLEVIENRTVSSLPFFQIFPVNVASEMCERQGTVHVSTEVRVETLNVWLSYQVLYFWHDVGFKTPEETESSQVPVHTNAFKLHLGKASLLLSDGRWSCNGPLVETLVRNLLVDATLVEHSLEATVAGDLLVNYNNIHKVMWEPFIEPWNVQLKMERKREQTALMKTSFVTDIHLRSTAQLNLNFTEPLIETIFRVNEMIKGSSSQTGVRDFSSSTKNLGSQATDSAYARRYAPYILQNDTSMPFVFWVSRGSVSVNNIDNLAIKKGNIVHPGSYVPIYIDESPEEPILHQRPAHSSERLNEKKNGVSHHMISIQLDGTSEPSLPLSMDLVGLSYFEVNFSKTSDTIEVGKDGNIPSCNRKIEEAREDHKSGFVFPVVFEVSVQRHGKLIRLYSTVILLNETSMPLELRFDIPFGVSSKVLDPIYPGKEFPLPVHLAESGRMRWRPLGANYLWSEAHPLSNILSQESRLGFLRSFVCYPSHPSSDPFRCCISIQDICLPSSNSIRNLSSCHIQECITPPYNLDKSKKRYIRQVRFTTPLLVKNCFPRALSFTIESGGVTRSKVIPEVDTASVFHIDSTHDLGILMHMHGFKSTNSMFPRAEVFMTMAKLNESKFSQSETLTFYPDERNGPLCVTVEKVMDAFCGARELCISVPFLLYNCSSLPLTICDCDNEKKGNDFFIPSCYHLMGQEKHLSGKPGLALLSSEEESFASPSNVSNSNNFSFEDHTISLRETSILNKGNAIGPMDFSRKKFVCESELIENEDGRRAKAYMYSPQVTLTASELMVRLTTCLPERGSKVIQSSFWSNPFFLVSPSGSICVTIPQPCSKGAFLVSATSSPIDGPLAGRTRAITFQPRYVISNACSKELCFKQKGTDFFYRLGVGQHSHLHWADTTRELLVSIRFNEPGWQWSGSFLPDHLGDAQVKMRKYAGALNMVRVEVQNANVSIGDEKIVGSSNGQSGTHLILLSDDNTGFMPYRIDNFSMERLRIYQQKCETFETTVHSYTSCPYAWDEPCYPHRLVVEVPGERVIGSYSLDDVRECIPVHLPQTSEKPERRLVLSVHAEGAIKVLSVVDSNYHILKDVKEAGFSGFKEKMKHDFKEAHEFIERVTIHLSFIGISLINSSPQEIVYTCAKDVKVEALQSVDRQKIYFHILSLQIDNQLRNSLYPVILSFDQEQRGSSPNLNYREDRLNPKQETGSPNVNENACESILSFAASKWRTSDSSLVSFEYINLRLAPLRIELEEQMLLSLFGFVRTATLSFRSRIPGHSYSDLQTLDNIVNFQAKSSMEYKSLDQLKSLKVSNLLEKHGSSDLLPSVVPIGAPWQQIFLLARRQKKIYIEVLDLAPIKLTLSFSSAPWMIRDAAHTEAVSLILVSNTVVQRGLMALVDVEGAPVYLRQLTIAHHLASWDSIKEILIRHYTRQLIHEMYKVFGSAGVIGNPMGFARNVGLGIKDFLSVPARGVLQSPSGLITGVALGTKSLVRNTVYAVSNAATQFSKAAHKGIVAFTFDEQAVAKQEKNLDSHSKGLLNEFLEGLTGFLQSPVKGVEKHGLPGVLSGIVLGTAGLVARPVASILEVTGKTAQSIRNRSSPHQSNRFRIRFPRPLARELPLVPYSWEEAIGTSMLLEAEDFKFMDEIFVMCKALKRAGKFVVITERLVLIFSCSSLVGFGSPEFCGIMDPEWVIEVEMGLESVVHIDREEEVVNIVGSSLETLLKQQQIKRGSPRGRRWGSPNSVPLFQTSVELSSREEAEDVLQVIWHTVEQGKGQRWGAHVLHRSNLR